jgi:HEAT repeat protein
MSFTGGGGADMTDTIYRLALAGLVGLLLRSPALAQSDTAPATQLAEDERTLEAHKIPTDGPGLLDYFRRRTASLADQAEIGRWVRLLGDPSYAVREDASRKLIDRGPAALVALRRALDDTDLEVKRRAAGCVEAIQRQGSAAIDGAAVRVLQARRPAEVVGVLLGYLPTTDDEGVVEEIRAALINLGPCDGRVEPALVAALNDPAPARRGLASLVVGRYGTADQQAQVRGLLADKDLKVRFLAAEGLLAGHDKRAIPVLIGVLEEGPIDLAWQADDWLRRVALDQSPDVSPGDSAAARRRSRAAWEAWWRTHESRLDLARAEVDLVALNPMQQAREATRRFLTALLKNDIPALKRATDVPFSLLGLENFSSRDELARFFAKSADRGESFTYQVQAIVGFDQYLARTSSKEKAFFTKFFKTPPRVVYIQVSEKGQKQPENLVLFVKISGQRAWVVGIGESRGQSK